jgi:transposase-like protein
MTELYCPICASDQIAHYPKPTSRAWKCAECGSIFLNPVTIDNAAKKINESE